MWGAPVVLEIVLFARRSGDDGHIHGGGPGMWIEQGEGGAIVNTSSMVGKYGQPSGFAYPTSKFAVNGLTLSLARELAKHKIRVRGRNIATFKFREQIK